MPRLYPPEPMWLDDNGAERRVSEKLCEALPDAALFHGVRVQDGAKDREIDLLIAWTGVSLAVIEVKGGLITWEGGIWRQSERPKPGGSIRCVKCKMPDTHYSVNCVTGV